MERGLCADVAAYNGLSCASISDTGDRGAGLETANGRAS